MLNLVHQTESQDGTLKVLWKLVDQHTIESVILPRSLKQRKGLVAGKSPGEVTESHRFTACVSSQVGCAMACDFCLTGKQGLIRHLSADEIIDQVKGLNEMKPITNIVFMGMGEPLQNLDGVLGAISYFLSPKGLGLSRRKILVSTSGVVHALPELAKTGVRLAISLNATTDELRSQIMPVNRRYPITSLVAAAQQYSLDVRQTVMIEYILLKGLNDSAEDAIRLRKLASGWNCKINLIPYNTFSESPYQRPDPTSVKQFQHELVSHGITATVRYSGGDDILAACGQLKSLDAIFKKRLR